ncbi:ATP-binding response regulator [Leptospira stimsonii]|uniref:Regulator n=1 Tax=Leptospira stimsonii TaxID=2202203 RepID=A0A4R9L6E0_9LEPT|nr:response regulator [Leptospira stimsonii]RHX85365.1 regulator [Leptospira stimsonii]TGK15780.1 response regulator [Leptospira stimsonii]TGM13598.1 response regulator [Leptospira stimsonii]
MINTIDIRQNQFRQNVLEQSIALRDPILILEDADEIRALLLQICKTLGIKAEGYANGKQALEAAREKQFSAFIVDLETPLIKGQDFIREIKTFLEDPIILVQTGNNQPDTIIEVMKLGVLDYLIKPIDIQVFGHCMKRISEYTQKKSTEKVLQEETETRLRAQLDWILYKQSWMSDLEKTVDVSKVTLNNIKQTFLSGGGIGAIVSLIEILKSSAKYEGENCVLSKEIADLLFVNNQTVHDTLHCLEKSMEILNRDISKEKTKMSVSDFFELIEQTVENASEKMEKFLSEKALSISFHKSLHPNSIQIEVDQSSIQLILEELIVNAAKYARIDSKILIYDKIQNGMLNLSFKNEFDSKSIPGVPKDKEILVKQPFYRLTGFVYESLPMETFFSGLGLTIVDFVARKHSGTFQISNILDHSVSEIPVETVLASLSLPLKY